MMPNYLVYYWMAEVEWADIPQQEISREIGGAWAYSHNVSVWGDRRLHSFHGWMLEVNDKHAFI